MSLETGNKRRIQEAIAALSEHDAKRFAEHHTDDVVVYDGNEEYRGVDAVETHAEGLVEAFPDLQCTLEDSIAEGDEVAFRFTLSGTHENEFEGMPASGESFEIEALGLVQLEDGKASNVWIQANEVGLREQIGGTEMVAD